MKYLELIKGQFTADHEARAKQLEPYVAYSVEADGVMYNFIPAPITGPADNEIWYKTTDMNYVQFDGVVSKSGGYLHDGSFTCTNSNNGEYIVASFSEDIDALDIIINGLVIPFEDHKKLTHILLPKGVLICSDTFGACTNLEVFEAEDFRFDSGGQSHFDNTKISEINIPSGVETIPSACFSRCSSLVNVSIPSTVITLSSNCFNGCTSLTTINYNGTIAQWEAIEKIDGWNSGCPEITVHCTDGDITIPANN